MGRYVIVIMIVTMAHELSSYEGDGLPRCRRCGKGVEFSLCKVPRSILYLLRFHLALCVSLKIWARMEAVLGKDNAMAFLNQAWTLLSIAGHVEL